LAAPLHDTRFDRPVVGKYEDENGNIVYETEAERIFTLMDQFFLGFKYNQILPSALNCSNFIEKSISKLNVTLEQWKLDQDPESNYTTTAEDYLFNVTEWISYSVAPGIRYCFNIGLEGYTYYLVKDEQFGPFADWFPAWLQNLLGSVVTFDQLYKLIKAASDSGNKEDEIFWYGRLAFIILDFKPLKKADAEIEFDSETAKPWWLDTGSNDLSSDLSWRKSSLNQGVRQRGLVESHHHPHVDAWYDDTYGFLAGFLNVTYGDASPNASICMSNVTRVVSVSLDFYNHIKVISNDSWLNASYDFQMIFETVHPIFFSCYRSGYEFYEATLDYVATFLDWRNLVYNLIHNIGFLYDGIYYLVVHHMKLPEVLEVYTERERASWFFKLGIYYGTLIFRIFYTDPNADYMHIDPMADLIGVVPKWMLDL